MALWFIKLSNMPLRFGTGGISDEVCVGFEGFEGLKAFTKSFSEIEARLRPGGGTVVEGEGSMAGRLGV